MKFLPLFFCFLYLQSQAQPLQDSLSWQLNEIYKQSQLPGFSVAIVGKNGVLYNESFGYADLEKKQPFTNHTAQTIASISKTFVGLAIMQLMREEKIDLDQGVNELLDFSVNHPHHPDVAITLRHLATHTSGILDGESYEKSTVICEPDFFDTEASQHERLDYLRSKKDNIYYTLGYFLKNLLYKNGIWYSTENWSAEAPGKKYEYSNTGAALAAYIVEVVSGMSFAEYTRVNILEPLDMKSSTWTFTQNCVSDRAKLYSTDLFSLPAYKSVTYPDGDLWSSSADLATFLTEIIKAFSSTESKLDSELVKEMLKPQIPSTALPESFQDHQGNYGIGWQINPRGLRGHSGSTPGGFSYLFFDPETGIGRVFLTNTTATQDEELMSQAISILRTLRKYQDRLTISE